MTSSRWVKRSVRSETHYTFAYFNVATRFFLERATADGDGRFYTCLATIVFSAFCIEAYLNEIGRERLACWDSLERTLSPKAKLLLITEHAGVPVDFSCRPFQSFNALFRLRDLVAHPKPGEFPRLEASCKPSNAKRLREDMREMITRIHEAAGFGSDPFTLMSFGGWKPSGGD